MDQDRPEPRKWSERLSENPCLLIINMSPNTPLLACTPYRVILSRETSTLYLPDVAIDEAEFRVRNTAVASPLCNRCLSARIITPGVLCLLLLIKECSHFLCPRPYAPLHFWTLEGHSPPNLPGSTRGIDRHGCKCGDGGPAPDHQRRVCCEIPKST